MSAHLSMVKYPNSPRTDTVTFTCYLIADGTLAATRSVTERMQFGGESFRIAFFQRNSLNGTLLKKPLLL